MEDLALCQTKVSKSPKSCLNREQLHGMSQMCGPNSQAYSIQELVYCTLLPSRNKKHTWKEDIPKKTDTSNSQVISGYHFSLQKYRMNNLKPVRPIFPTISPLKAWLARVTSRSSLVPVISGGMQQVTGKTQVHNDVCRMLVRGLLVPSEKKKSTCEETIISWSFLLSQSSGSICQAFTDFHPIQLKNTRILIP